MTSGTVSFELLFALRVGFWAKRVAVSLLQQHCRTDRRFNEALRLASY